MSKEKILTPSREQFHSNVHDLLKKGYTWIDGSTEWTAEPWDMYMYSTVMVINHDTKKFAYMLDVE